jgi:hypothetical protein
VGPRQIIGTIPLDSLLDVIAGRRTVLNVPEGAKIVSAWFDGFAMAGKEPSARLLRIRMEAESLPETQDGARLPMMRFHAPWTKPKS